VGDSGGGKQEESRDVAWLTMCRRIPKSATRSKNSEIARLMALYFWTKCEITILLFVPLFFCPFYSI
jgi:hypothetical protein